MKVNWTFFYWFDVVVFILEFLLKEKKIDSWFPLFFFIEREKLKSETNVKSQILSQVYLSRYDQQQKLTIAIKRCSITLMHYLRYCKKKCHQVLVKASEQLCVRRVFSLPIKTAILSSWEKFSALYGVCVCREHKRGKSAMKCRILTFCLLPNMPQCTQENQARLRLRFQQFILDI